MYSFINIEYFRGWMKSLNTNMMKWHGPIQFVPPAFPQCTAVVKVFRNIHLTMHPTPRIPSSVHHLFYPHLTLNAQWALLTQIWPSVALVCQMEGGMGHTESWFGTPESTRCPNGLQLDVMAMRAPKLDSGYDTSSKFHRELLNTEVRPWTHPS